MNSLQPPFSDIVGESSPVQKAIKMIWEIFANHPLPNNKSIASQSAAEQIVLHLLGTMNSIGMINAAGYHSAAVTLMRSIEDALDCLFAVVQSDINANKWLNGELKASQAARAWTADKVVDQSIPLGDYRKNIRHGLNKYSHCSPNQTSWNIYRKSDEKGMCRLELNYQHAVISMNETRFSNIFIEKRVSSRLESLERSGLFLFAAFLYLLQNSQNSKLIFLCKVVI